MRSRYLWRETLMFSFLHRGLVILQTVPAVPSKQSWTCFSNSSRRFWATVSVQHSRRKNWWSVFDALARPGSIDCSVDDQAKQTRESQQQNWFNHSKNLLLESIFPLCEPSWQNVSEVQEVAHRRHLNSASRSLIVNIQASWQPWHYLTYQQHVMCWVLRLLPELCSVLLVRNADFFFRFCSFIIHYHLLHCHPPLF